MTYQGWKTYETWNCALWLNQTPNSYKEELIKQAKRTNDPTGTLANMLKDHIQENKPDLKGLYSDLLQSAIGSIDFYEIAERELSD